MRRKILVSLLMLWMCSIHLMAQTIVNGVPWYDQNYEPVNAHGAGLLRDNGRYWLFGEYKSDTSNAFPGFGCYSSEDLVNWRFERVVLPVQKDGILGPNRVGERVKVMRCPKTGEYVMLMHADNMNYKDPHIGIATCKTVNGDYQLKGTLLYKGQPVKRWDMGVFQDEDGKGYLLTHHGPVYRLSDDYLSVDTMIANVKGMGESPVMFKKDGIYYLLTSNLTSWERNDNYYFTATNIAGPWKKQGTFCPEGSLTWNSQSTFVLMLPDGTPMYMGDRWSYPHQASSATYVWMPMMVEGEKLSIPEYWQAWDPNHVSKVNWQSQATKQIPVPFSSNVKGKKKEVTFEGAQVVLVGKTDCHGGYAKVSIYNERGKEIHSNLIDFYSKQPNEGIRYVSPVLPKAKYRLVVTVTGDRSVWADKRKNNYGTDDSYVHLSKLYVYPLSGVLNKSKEATSSLKIDMTQHGASVSPSLHGIFFEEINHAGDGGLYAELIQNRSFEDMVLPEGYVGKPGKLFPKKTRNHVNGEFSNRVFRWYRDSLPGWSFQGQGATMRLTQERPKFTSAPTNMNIHITDETQKVNLVNSGFWGMNLVKGDDYLLRVIIRTSKQYKGKVTARLLDHDGKMIASAPLSIGRGKPWEDIQVLMTPTTTDGKGKFDLQFEDGKGDVWVDYVSLFPKKTFKNRPNGLRKDLAQAIADMKPAFVRWPGGSIVGGITLADRYKWKQAMGDPAARSGQLVRWGYTTTGGFGYKEMLEFCEDLGAQAMFVCNCSLADQYGYGEAAPADSIGTYVKECMDAIDYALGGDDTEWGHRRIAEGHQAPYPLAYVEVGNENWGDEYDRRFDIFYKAIKEKYPQLKIVSNNSLWGNKHQTHPDILDPHFYGTPMQFLANTTMLDSLKRTGSEVYYGEYSCNGKVKEGYMQAALAEAAFIGAMERNGDLVTMASYAPLLRNQNVRHWPVNLIHYTSDSVLLRSSYYVQKMASENIPTYNLKTEFSDNTANSCYPDGLIAIDTKHKSFDVKDVVFQKEGATQIMTCKILRKEYSKKGLDIFFATDATHKKGYRYNLGCWIGNFVSPGIIGVGDEGICGQYKMDNQVWYDVKLVVNPQHSELYINGEKVASHTPHSIPVIYASTGYDEKTKELVLKVVNLGNVVNRMNIDIQNAISIKSEGKVTVLAANSMTDENTFANPTKIQPIENEYNHFSKNFTYDFKPCSYTILRVKIKE